MQQSTASGYPVSAAWFWGVLAAAAVWTVRAYFWPFAACGWCKGRGRRQMGKRHGDCRWCRGSGRRQVKGSKTVHRAVRSLRNARKDGK